jgi:dihydrofolate synthase/folylpolyglutamate synthase
MLYPNKASSLNMSNSEITDSNEFTFYEKILRELYHVENVKRGLLNMIELNDVLDRPLEDPSISVMHVAGTNGKGSVALKTARVLEFSGFRVGLLISPHIASFRERISINGELITEKEVERYLPKILEICNVHNIPATFFEITTALSFVYFKEKAVDVVVLETGLGGRLDATNVIPKPDLCIITSIGLEHTAILGDTIELIAKEKAGIIKHSVPVLVGPNVPHDVIRECAVEKEAEGYYISDEVLGGDSSECRKNVNGIEYIDYDIENSRTVQAAIKLLCSKHEKFRNVRQESIDRGTSMRPACRFEEIQCQSGSTCILDIAHNPPAMFTLVAKLISTYPERTYRYIVGFSADKDVNKITDLLLSTVSNPNSIHLVEAVNLRAAKIADIIKAVPSLALSNFEDKDRSITAQVKLAMSLAAKNNEVLVICGSVFLMAEARTALGIDEPRDSDAITSVAGKGLMACKEKLLKASNKN